MNIWTQLQRPFPVDKIHWRVGATNARKLQSQDPKAKATKGIALAYIDARDVMHRLDVVVGPANWQCRYSHVSPAVCELGIRVDNEWLWRANGAGETDVEGEKGALSDAFKRAGVLWGIGRYLYQLPNVWVDLNERGQIVTPPMLPEWATPEGFDKRVKNG